MIINRRCDELSSGAQCDKTTPRSIASGDGLSDSGVVCGLHLLHRHPSPMSAYLKSLPPMPNVGTQGPRAIALRHLVGDSRVWAGHRRDRTGDLASSRITMRGWWPAIARRSANGDRSVRRSAPLLPPHAAAHGRTCRGGRGTKRLSLSGRVPGARPAKPPRGALVRERRPRASVAHAEPLTRSPISPNRDLC